MGTLHLAVTSVAVARSDHTVSLIGGNDARQPPSRELGPLALEFASRRRAHLRQSRLRTARRVELAAAGGGPVKGDALATPKFLENILSDLRQSGLIRSQRGSEGGYWLARPERRSRSPTSCAQSTARSPAYAAGGRRRSTTRGAARQLQRVWIAVRHNLRAVVESVTVADLATGELPATITKLSDDPEAWVTR